MNSKWISLVVLVTFVFLGICCNEPNQEEALNIVESPSSEMAYDSLLAKRLGADDYGMSRYVLALLKAGPNRDQDSTTAAQIQEAHMANIRRMADEGKLVLAGPFLDGGPLQGIYVFNVATVEEARALTETDPAVKAGRLVMDLHPWYGSAALQEVGPMHSRVSKESF